MSAPTAIRKARRAANRLMIDTFEVRQITGHSTPDPVTGKQTTLYEVLFTTEGKIQDGGPGDSNSRATRAGNVEAAFYKPSWQTPITAPLAPRNAIVVCTATHPDSDAANVGRKFRVLTPAPKTLASARRYEVQAVI